jgi:hypothetical protein
MKRYSIRLTYTAQVTARFQITESQLKEALEEKRFGEIDGEDWQKAEKLFESSGYTIANEISQSTWDYQPIELGPMDFTIRQEYRTDEAAENDNSEDNSFTELEASEVFLTLERVAWLDDVEVEEHESTY